jgi:ElaB/YqjD/DUF883 family membrane-anchored ribosome-binding protein
MPTPQETFRNATNSPTGRQAAEKARSMAEDVGDAAGRISERVSDVAGDQYAKAQDMAVDAYDQAHAAAQRNPLMAVGIALGIGFLFGALSTARR